MEVIWQMNHYYYEISLIKIFYYFYTFTLWYKGISNVIKNKIHVYPLQYHCLLILSFIDKQLVQMYAIISFKIWIIKDILCTKQDI